MAPVVSDPKLIGSLLLCWVTETSCINISLYYHWVSTGINRWALYVDNKTFNGNNREIKVSYGIPTMLSFDVSVPKHIIDATAMWISNSLGLKWSEYIKKMGLDRL